MRIVLSVLFYVSLTISSWSNSVEDDLYKIYSLLQTDNALATELSLSLKDRCESEGNYYGLSKANYYLGYLHDQKGVHNKAVVFYLEALRTSKKAHYDGAVSDQISLNKNLGNIFRKFNAYELSSTYNQHGIDLASQQNDTSQVVSLKFNEALNLRDQKKNHESIVLFEGIYDLSSPSRRLRILNEIGLLHLDEKNYLEAKYYFGKLISESTGNLTYESKALHNLGVIHFHENNLDSSIYFSRRALTLQSSQAKKDFRNLFITYKTLGEYLLIEEQFKESHKFLSQAEELIPSIPNHVENFKLYELYSAFYFKIGEYNRGKHYASLYSSSLEKYISTQSLLQETDQRYNMDLITKRYFAEVKKQDRIAEIMLASQLTSGSLLALLLLVIGYHRYQKIMLRKSIERELVSLRLID